MVQTSGRLCQSEGLKCFCEASFLKTIQWILFWYIVKSHSYFVRLVYRIFLVDHPVGSSGFRRGMIVMSGMWH